MYTRIKSFIPYLAFVIALTIPLAAHAANFTCDNSLVFTDQAKLTITATGKYDIIADTDLYILPVVSASTPSPTLKVPDVITDFHNDQALFTYENLSAGTTYRVLAFDSNLSDKFIEEITACQFTVPAGKPVEKGADPIAASSGTQTQTGTVALPTVTSPDLVAPSADAAAAAKTTTTTTTAAPVDLSANIGGNTSGSNGMGLIPCDGGSADPCTLDSVLQLMNNLLTFFFKYLLIPLFVIMIMSLGYGYLTAGGNPSQHAKLKSMIKHLVLGLLLMLCAWLIVRTILSVLGYTDDLFFFGK